MNFITDNPIIKKIADFTHDNLGWGYPKELISPDSFQSVYSCRRCDGELAQDSQGNWFHLTKEGAIK